MLIKKEDVGLSKKLLKEYKEQLNCLSSDQLEFSIGLCLGDASLQKQSKTLDGPRAQYRMKFEWGDKNKEYAFHIYETFSEWILSPPRAQDRISPISKKPIRTWRFQTISHHAFYPLAELFISPENGKKRIIPDIVQKYLTPQGLAYWYMDDGGLASRDRFAINLNTQGFQFHEVEILCEELAKKFEFICWPKKNKKGYCIVISGHSYISFRDLCKPWIEKVPCMQYKLPVRNKKKE